MKEHITFFKNILIYTIATFATGLEGLILLPLLTKNLSLSQYGIWSQIMITISLLTPIALFGLNASFVRFFTSKKNKQKISEGFFSVLYFYFFSGGLLSLIIFFSSDSISVLLIKNYSASIFFKIASIIVFLRCFRVLLSSVLKIREDYKRISFLELILSISHIILASLFIKIGLELSGVIIAFILSEVILIILSVLFTNKLITIQKPSKKTFWKMFDYGSPLVFVPLFHWIFQVGDQYILGYHFGSETVGIYAFAYSIAYIIRTLATPLITVLYTRLLSEWNNNKSRFKETFDYSYKYLFIILIPATAGIIALSREIILIFGTKEYLPALKLIPILVIGILLFNFTNLSNLILRIENKTSTIRNLFFILAASNIILNIILIPRYGFLGAAIATFITFVCSFIHSMVIFSNHKIDTQMKTLLKIVIAASAMSLIVFSLRNIDLAFSIKIPSLVLIGLLSYGVLLLLFKIVKLNEIRYIKSLIFNKVKEGE